MVLAAEPKPAGRRELATAIAALIATQMIGWGTTFHVPAVLSKRISAGTGLSSSVVFSGITVMLLVAAAVSPLAGRLLDRHGARRWMPIGSLLTVLGLTILAGAEGLVGYVAAWLVIGLAMPLMLNQGASTALVQIAPERARGALTMLMLVSGFSSTIAWPVLIGLDDLLGWRRCVVLCAGIHLFVCAPLHLLCLPRIRRIVEAAALAPATTGSPPARPAQPPPAIFALAAITFSLAGMLTWGLPLHMIGILQDFGHTEATAVAIGALLGPSQVLSRAFELAGGHRVGILAVGVGSIGLMPPALAVLLLWGTTLTGAVVFTIGYGLSAGLISILRAVAPIRLFGVAAYATMLGRLGLSQNIAFAAAPLGFAMLRDTVGSGVLVAVSLAVSLVCLATMIGLASRAPPAPR